jgi:hypothetical protein
VDCRQPVSLDRQIDFLHAHGYLSTDVIRKARRLLAEQGLSWSGLDEFIELRRELCAIDVWFGELTTGIFESLDQKGVIPDHRVVTETEIRSASVEAPLGTRAAVRARWIEHLSDRRDRYVCGWSGISGEYAQLNLSDPFATEARWERAAAPWAVHP